MQPAVYILANQRNGTLYIGVTSNPVQRIYQHKQHFIQGFTKRYKVTCELHETMISAISREKQLKKWLRKWKVELIEKSNPDWCDLWQEIIA
ncbi:GIY-YIG nuclease family protein [Neisseria lisongii]|uniref:GIY-YIG nuclease family protein n=1 Tax=Neisseria lisongii TaxID=2912188 RepID=A0AAW5AEY0_9NEIS|nr:GIY-YIG nuclease family protein [Neisseria lisongii]MCF7528732.1 GIY-YIG nuclease family protein [Neisseria lisongii]MCF7529590.1 GIY-YIG nuclease family protein [Neisseria lisongii]